MSAWTDCPVCTQKTPPGSIRCKSCGADFSDPDVMAMAGVEAVVPDVGGGQLASSKLLGATAEGLKSGASLRKLAWLGAALLAVGFLVPVSEGFTHTAFSWSAEGPTFALWLPLIAALLGVGVAAAPGLTPWQRAAAMTALGLVGLASLPWLGALAGAPDAPLIVLTIGLAVLGAGLGLRLLSPQSSVARYLAIGGALVAVAGLLVPIGEAESALPAELRFYLTDALGTAPPAKAYVTVFNRDPSVFFVALLALSPLLLAPIAAGLAWPRPTGAWDKADLLLRPLAWAILLYWPTTYLLSAFNIMGWNHAYTVIIDGRMLLTEDFTGAALTGRLRLVLLAVPYALWAQLPALTLHERFASKA